MTSNRTRPSVRLGAGSFLAAVAIAIAACGGGSAATPSPSSSPTGSGSPSPSASPSSPTPSGQPSPTPGTVVTLDVADPHTVTVSVVDRAGGVKGVASGRAGDGMSVRWGAAEVVNVDADTVRVTWPGLPVDASVRLAVTADGKGYALVFTQPAPPANSDATGYDRVIVLDFAAPVRAADVTVSFSAA